MINRAELRLVQRLAILHLSALRTTNVLFQKSSGHLSPDVSREALTRRSDALG